MLQRQHSWGQAKWFKDSRISVLQKWREKWRFLSFEQAGWMQSHTDACEKRGRWRRKAGRAPQGQEANGCRWSVVHDGAATTASTSSASPSSLYNNPCLQATASMPATSHRRDTRCQPEAALLSPSCARLRHTEEQRYAQHLAFPSSNPVPTGYLLQNQPKALRTQEETKY